MSVLVYIEVADGEIKKSSLETAGYASELAKLMNTDTIAVVFSNVDKTTLSKIGNYGVKKVYQIDNGAFSIPSVMPYAAAIAQLVNKINIQSIVMPKSSVTDALVSRLAVKLKAGVVTNVLELLDTSSGFKVKRSIYTGKAFSIVELNTEIKILTIAKNAHVPSPSSEIAEVEVFDTTISEKDGVVKSKEIQKSTGDILLTEADLVVSGGRGFKGPENWNLLLDLAKAMKAGTGCSKPVSDMDWRPHHEHVGQTGVKVSPNLYIAVGISGAIQHLAGVNSSKVIVVINKDPEAPFFKAADYGICGDLFEILPKLTAAAKNYFN